MDVAPFCIRSKRSLLSLVSMEGLRAERARQRNVGECCVLRCSEKDTVTVTGAEEVPQAGVWGVCDATAADTGSQRIYSTALSV